MFNIENWGFPQYCYLVLTFIGLLVVSNEHGKPRTGQYNIFSTLATCIFVLSLLYFGGFFK
jgi:hypothetical protein